MSLDNRSPASDPLGKVSIFGTPFHGRVQGGVLTLPNAATKTYPQPTGDRPDENGTAHLVRVPGTPAVSRSAAQQAADDAAGFEWRNQAMLSGGGFQLYGEALGGWIYTDPAGLRWLVRITAGLSTFFSFSESLALTVTVSRFGAFGAAASSTVHSLSLSSWGQQGYPALQGFVLEDGNRASITTAAVFVEGIYSDGSRAALSVHQPITESSDPLDLTLHHAVKYALGWVELSISGSGASPTLGLTLLKNRAETLQVISQTVTNLKSTALLPALSEDGVGINATSGAHSFNFETLRLVAAWPDELDSSWMFVAERYSDSGNSSGGFSGSGLTYTATTSQERSIYIALEVDGVEHSRVESITDSTGTVLFESVEEAGEFDKLNVIQAGSIGTYTLNGVEFDFSAAATGVSDEIFEGTFSFDAVPESGNVYVSYQPTRDIFLRSWRWPVLGGQSPGPLSVVVDLCRHSGKVFSQRYQRVDATTDTFVYLPRLTPSGGFGSAVTRTFSGTERLYASWCPHTLQIADIQTTPVCWV